MQVGRSYVDFGILFEPRDFWVGVYWKRYPCAIDIYICVLPMLPLKIYWQWNMEGRGATHAARD